MSEEEKTGVTDQQNVAQEAVAQPTESEQVRDERQDEVQSQQSKRNDADYNWKETRRQIQERDRLIEEQKQLIEKLSKGIEPSVDDDISQLSDDDIITVKQHKKMSAQIAKQVAEEVVRQREALTLEDRLEAKFSDFKSVVTAENIDYLKQTEPELAQSLSAMSKDPYAQGVAVYKLLKKMGKTDPNSNALEKKKASENSQKPLSVQAATKQSAIGNAHMFENGLTADLKKQLYKEMQEAIRG